MIELIGFHAGTAGNAYEGVVASKRRVKSVAG